MAVAPVEAELLGETDDGGGLDAAPFRYDGQRLQRDVVRSIENVVGELPQPPAQRVMTREDRLAQLRPLLAP